MARFPASREGARRSMRHVYFFFVFCVILVGLETAHGGQLSMKVVRHSNGSTFFVSWNDRKSLFRSVYPIHRVWYDEVDESPAVQDSIIDSLPWREELAENRLTGKTNARVCPCTGQPGAQRIEQPAFSASAQPVQLSPIRLCVVESRYTHIIRRYSSPLVHLTFVPYRAQYSSHWRIPSTSNSNRPNNASSCAMIVHFVPEHRINKHFCPETCKPVPIVRLAWQWLDSSYLASSSQSLSSRNATLVTCSMTLHQFHNLAQDWMPTLSGSSGAFADPAMFRGSLVAHPLSLLLLLLLRRQQECHEPREWLRVLAPTVRVLQEFSPPETTGEVWTNRVLRSPQRRRVRSLWLSIGSLSRQDLQVDQFSLLRHKSGLDRPDSVAGWSATEDVYDCASENRCVYVTTDNQYMAYMPRTGMPDAPHGWACAQQRTLRALVHVLKLFDPDFVFVMDDDTFVSKYLAFHPSLDALLEERLLHSNAVLGSLQLADRDVTRNGFYWGGSGLLIGRAALDLLQSHRIPAVSRESRSRRNDTLSIHREALHNANELCPSCIVAQTEESLLAAVSLLEVCSNLMAHADTCFHSDHAISRCLAHGSYSTFLSAHCQDKRRFFGDGRLSFGMCYPYDICRPGEHLTCHRFRVNRSDEYNAFSLDSTDRIATTFVPPHVERPR